MQAEGAIGLQEIGGGLYAAAIHKGPYEAMGQTYARLCGEWIPQNGYRLRPLAGFEVYLNNPNSTKPEELLTEINLPVEKAG